MIIIQKFEEFNQRRYSNPWVARVNPETGKIDFKESVGGYTGRYGAGEAGELYFAKPIDGAVYAYGQKDYRGNNGFTAYVQYKNGELEEVQKSQLIEALSKANQ